jgi:hypothetical protein
MKATFRLPEPLMDELRRRSEDEGRSLNSTAIDVLWRGLGREVPEDDVTRVLGTFIVRPALKRYDPDSLAAHATARGEEARGLLDALEWARSGR